MKTDILLVMRYDVTRGTVSTVNNTNSIVFSAPFANVGRSNVTQPAIGAVPILYIVVDVCQRN